MTWFWYAAITAVLFTILYLIYKKIGQAGVSKEVMLFYYYILAVPVMMAAFFLREKTTSLYIDNSFIFLLMLAALVGVIGNITIVESIKNAPNPGYSLAVSGVNVLLVAIFSVFLFGSDFSTLKWIGLVMVVIGIILLGI